MNNQKQKMELLGNAPIPKALLAMGIPTMIGMLINALYNLVDAYFVGGLGESQMGAISIVYIVSPSTCMKQGIGNDSSDRNFNFQQEVVIPTQLLKICYNNEQVL